MPESDFARLHPGAGVDRVGSPGDTGPMNVGVNVRHDPTLVIPLAHALRVPGMPEAPPEPLPPPPAPPTEQELRQQLGEALDAQHAAEATLRRAESAHERAERNLTRCQTAMASFASLDTEIAASVVEALRCDAGRLSPELSETHELRIADRERARTELVAAEAALIQFRAERAEASAACGDATRAAQVLAARVLSHLADRLAREHDDLIAQARLRRAALFGYERMTTATKVGISMQVRNVLGTDAHEFARQHDSSAWWAAHTALLADPQATVTIEPQPVREAA
jgi:hypothetical protein